MDQEWIRLEDNFQLPVCKYWDKYSLKFSALDLFICEVFFYIAVGEVIYNNSGLPAIILSNSKFIVIVPCFWIPNFFIGEQCFSIKFITQLDVFFITVSSIFLFIVLFTHLFGCPFTIVLTRGTQWFITVRKHCLIP